MKLKNIPKRIEEINKELLHNTKLIYGGCRYTIKSYKKKDVEGKSPKSLVHMLNGQRTFLNKQQETLSKERWDKRRLLRELRMLYRYVEKIRGEGYARSRFEQNGFK